ncbi:ABC transporter permease [Aurantibacillus circumpalustris]|uniref:ABC transporter permease n=1 Tax=Aurantibacillus circumpalustris TaxID=3036359 RepID=UPI00295B8590|nr:ABC transporter permease [Aurantibacillus circumpalustris]
MLHNYIVTALRNLWRGKVFSLINIFGLSIGIASCMLIFLYAKDEINFDRFHKDNIYRITASLTNSKGEVNKVGNTGLMPGPRFTEQIPEIESFVRVQAAYCVVKKGVDVFEEDALWADENFFEMFNFPLLYGDVMTPLKDPHSIVISEDIANKYFGKTDVVGQTIQLNPDKTFDSFIVSAVAKNSPQNSSIKINMILPIQFQLNKEPDDTWMNFFLNTFVTIKSGSNIVAVAAKANLIFEKEAADQLKIMKEKYDFDEKAEFGFQPLTAMHLSKDYPSSNGLVNASNPIYSYILSGIALFILLIACINFVNLTVARSLKRAKEIGIRKVVGGQRKQLIFQFLGESSILAFFSFLFAIVLVVVILPFFNSISDKALSFSYLLDLKLAGAYFLLFVLTSLLAGFYPALVLSRFNPVETLYGKMRFSGKSHLARGLIVLQFTLAVFLIITTITVFSQFNYLVNYDLGYDKSSVLRIITGHMNKTKMETLKSELKRESAIGAITARQGGGYITIAHINGETNQEFGYNRIDEENFPLFKIPIVQGRNFSKDYPTDSTNSLIVNESFVKAARWKNPIGEVIDFFYKNKKYHVVGVVKDFHTGPLTEKITPQVFSVDPELPYQVLFLKINSNGKTAALNHAQKVVKTMFPAIPYHYTFLDEDLISQYKNEVKWKQIISFAALLTLFLSCIGLFGITALSAEKRSKEVSIRRVLGASVALIVSKLSFDFLKLVCIAGFISMPLAWWAMNTWLENYPYRIHLGLSTFVFALLAVLMVASFTIIFQAIKAAIANPIKSLRTE